MRVLARAAARTTSPRRSPLLAGVLALVLAPAGCALFPEDPPETATWPRPRHGMVVSEHPLATRAGLDMLEAGGNAADAAVATALALAVVYPQAGNLGGGGFAVWVPHEAGGEPLCLDFRETAPRNLAPELFLDEEGRPVAERSLGGHLAVGVPGSPRGLWELHRRLGRLSFRDVAAPAIALAREGFPVDAWLARDLLAVDGRRRLEESRLARTTFYPGGRPLQEGQRLRQPQLATTLELFVDQGPDVFYEGEVAAAIVGEMRRGGGVLDRRDLADYQVVWREPLRGWFRGLEILTAPPPSSGGLILLQVLAILDGFPLDQERRDTLEALALERGEPLPAAAPTSEEEAGEPAQPVEPGLSGRALHWWVEALRRAFADRVEHMGDPAFWDVPVDALLSPSWIAQRRTSIGELADPAVEPLPADLAEDGDTTHLSVLDGDGNAVSLTTTLNTTFGSGVMVDGGFLLNNEIDDFSILAGVPNEYGLVGSRANAIEPGKRPLSSMTPAVVRDGGQVVRMVLGSPGGPRIISAVIQVILRTEVYGQRLADAVAAPRLHQQYAPPETKVEHGWEPRLLQGLRNRGHEVLEVGERFGSVQAIRVDIGRAPEGASDPRRGGAVGAEARGLSEAQPPRERRDAAGAPSGAPGP